MNDIFSPSTAIERFNPEPGVYDDVSNEDYQRGPGISNSGLLLVGKAPRLYWGKRLDPNRPPEESKGGQLEGTLCHCATLEPDAFDARYVIGPTVHRATKIWKEFIAGLAPGQVGIQQPQKDVAFAQAASLREIPDVAETLSSGRPEVSAYWIDEETGQLCKIRPDWVHETPRGDILLDLKTYSSAEPGEFRKQIERKRYFQQAAMYSEGWEQASGHPVLGFVFAAVETEHPFLATPVMLDEDGLAAGRRMFRHNLELYAACRESGVWPSYTSGIEIISLSRFVTG